MSEEEKEETTLAVSGEDPHRRRPTRQGPTQPPTPHDDPTWGSSGAAAADMLLQLRRPSQSPRDEDQGGEEERGGGSDSGDDDDHQGDGTEDGASGSSADEGEEGAEAEAGNNDAAAHPGAEPEGGFRFRGVGLSSAVVWLSELNLPLIRRIEAMGVHFAPDAVRRDGGAQFTHRGEVRDFVTELKRYHRIDEIQFVDGVFVLEDWHAAQEEADDDEAVVVIRGADADVLGHELDRLFGTVLPNHPSLARIVFDRSTIQERYLRLYTEAVARHPSPVLTHLYFEGTHLGVEHARLLKAMLHPNMVLAKLRLWHCGLGTDGLRLVCEGVGTMRRLAQLNVRDNDAVVHQGTVVAAVRPRSNLSQLLVSSQSWSHAAFAELLEALRINASLEHVFVRQHEEEGPFRDMDIVEEMLGCHNFTLANLVMDPPSRSDGPDGLEAAGRIAALLNRNVRVRTVHSILDTLEYRVPHLALWPRILKEISAFPKLLYRYVRRGNVEAFAELVVTAAAHGGRKRSRDQH